MGFFFVGGLYRNSFTNEFLHWSFSVTEDEFYCWRLINLLYLPTIKCNKMGERTGINAGNLKGDFDSCTSWYVSLVSQSKCVAVLILLSELRVGDT